MESHGKVMEFLILTKCKNPAVAQTREKNMLSRVGSDNALIRTLLS